MAAANVDGELEVFCALYKPGEHFRLTLRFLVQPSEMRRAVMARRSDLAVVRFLFSRRLGVSLAPRETQPEIFSHVCRPADTINSQTFCGAAETMPGKPELQGGTRAVNSSLVMVQEVGWTRIDRS